MGRPFIVALFCFNRFRPVDEFDLPIHLLRQAGKGLVILGYVNRRLDARE